MQYTGKAQTAWKRLSSETKDDYEAGKETLQNVTSQTVSESCILLNFRLGDARDESWSDLADELRILAEKALPELDDKAKELLALERYLGELDNPQVAFTVRQREPKTVDEAVTATLEIQSYLRPGLRQELNASAVAEEAEVHSISVTSSSGSGQDAVVEMLKTLTERLERLELR